jgi:hypothetical protein
LYHYLKYLKNFENIEAPRGKQDINCKVNLLKNFNKHLYVLNKNKRLVEYAISEVAEHLVSKLLLSKSSILLKLKYAEKGSFPHRLKIFVQKQIDERLPFVRVALRDALYASLIREQKDFDEVKMKVELERQLERIQKRLGK